MNGMRGAPANSQPTQAPAQPSTAPTPNEMASPSPAPMTK